MTQEENGTAGAIPPPANDNDTGREEVARHYRTIAQAIGRHIAREHFRAWEKRRQQAANNNRSAPPEEEGRFPEG